MSIERWLGAIAGISAGLALLYYLYAPTIQDFLPHKAVEVPQVQAAPPPAADEQAPQFPVPEAPADEPAAPKPPAAETPSSPPSDLAMTDADIRAALSGVFGADVVDTFLVHERLVQKIVVTIDSLDRDPVPLRMRAVIDLPELPIVDKQGDDIVLSPDNGQRYKLMVDAFARADTHAIANLYLRNYALFQRAYRELGYPSGYFNDRLVAIIDHLLATPEPARPLKLVRPKVLYEYADPSLEALSSGQKAMLRIGPENAAVVKKKLSELRAIVAARGPARKARP